MQLFEIYKTKPCVRKAVRKYQNKVKENEPEKYEDNRKYHISYNKMYYQKMKDDRAKLKQLLELIQEIFKNKNV